jgi:hypothetical protein
VCTVSDMSTPTYAVRTEYAGDVVFARIDIGLDLRMSLGFVVGSDSVATVDKRAATRTAERAARLDPARAYEVVTL